MMINHLVMHITKTAVLVITVRVSDFMRCIIALTSSDRWQEIQVYWRGCAYLSPIMQHATKV